MTETHHCRHEKDFATLSATAEALNAKISSLSKVVNERDAHIQKDLTTLVTDLFRNGIISEIRATLAQHRQMIDDNKEVYIDHVKTTLEERKEFRARQEAHARKIERILAYGGAVIVLGQVLTAAAAVWAVLHG